jgi:hypothetical protein
MKKWRVAEKSGAVKQDKREETEMMLFIFHLLPEVTCVCILHECTKEGTKD